jgi:uptake hydrogenase large subunit
MFNMAKTTQTTTRLINAPLNRVEGDLDIKVELEHQQVKDAWSSGTMFRGIESILKGRGPLDSLVITPRICGVCSTSHLSAAVQAIETAAEITIPENAVIIRNIAQITEQLQSDMRQTFLMFTPDFTNQAYKDNPLYDEACSRYQPFKGETVIDTIRRTKQLLEIIAIIGGQWPHSSYMVPGGISSLPVESDVNNCIYLLENFTNWYEQKILGCTVTRFNAISSVDELDEWLHDNPSHHNSDLGFYLRFGRQIGLDQMGRGVDNYLSFGHLPLPANTMVSGRGQTEHLIPGGFLRGDQLKPFAQENIREHIAHSWFKSDVECCHPLDAKSTPWACGDEGDRYSWIKAPRYQEFPAETGALAEVLIGGNPLFKDLHQQQGASVYVRQLARIVRGCELIPAMRSWLREIKQGGEYYWKPAALTNGIGCGLTHGARGALAHWVKMENGRIDTYKIITPTAWNGSPRDSENTRGPWEEALIGTAVADADNPVELGHVIRSFDPCLVCAVHAINGARLSVRRFV